MKAYLRSARIAPKKANIIAMMVRDMRVDEALTALERTHKKGARMIETLLRSALANAHHNDKQHKADLMIKSIVVNQGTAYQRGTPMARGRMRPMNKFLSHIEITLGIAEAMTKGSKKPKSPKTPTAPKSGGKASQSAKNAVKESSSEKEATEKKSSTSNS